MIRYSTSMPMICLPSCSSDHLAEFPQRSQANKKDIFIFHLLYYTFTTNIVYEYEYDYEYYTSFLNQKVSKHMSLLSTLPCIVISTPAKYNENLKNKSIPIRLRRRKVRYLLRTSMDLMYELESSVPVGTMNM